MSMVEMMEMICDEENSNIRQKVEMCIDEMDIEPYKEIMKQCNPEFGDDFSGEALMKYSCEQTQEQWKEADECAIEKMKEEGKDEEEGKKIMKDMTECVERRMSEESERK
ncbi:hypothetical protein HNY73_011860 [Argiope bruennichi]|uniref:Uncharacterized protein n=2 Tax=Argiope bruennichi TaxID=94029 RepID=A0A8T0EXL1_ARGBR|nr:hypothetical protein HNY73_011860 [Argiope bruennichi]